MQGIVECGFDGVAGVAEIGDDHADLYGRILRELYRRPLRHCATFGICLGQHANFERGRCRLGELPVSDGRALLCQQSFEPLFLRGDVVEPGEIDFARYLQRPAIDQRQDCLVMLGGVDQLTRGAQFEKFSPPAQELLRLVGGIRGDGGDAPHHHQLVRFGGRRRHARHIEKAGGMIGNGIGDHAFPQQLLLEGIEEAIQQGAARVAAQQRFFGKDREPLRDRRGIQRRPARIACRHVRAVVLPAQGLGEAAGGAEN